jgi:hypothetical protein
MSAPDPFTLGGRQDDADAEILALFRRWIDQTRAANEIGKETPEIDLQDIPEWWAAQEALDRLEEEIADVPVEGASGLVVKGYIAAFRRHGGSNKDAAALVAHAHIGDCEAGFLCDAERFVPKIADLTKWALVEEDGGSVLITQPDGSQGIYTRRPGI